MILVKLKNIFVFLRSTCDEGYFVKEFGDVMVETPIIQNTCEKLMSNTTCSGTPCREVYHLFDNFICPRMLEQAFYECWDYFPTFGNFDKLSTKLKTCAWHKMLLPTISCITQIESSLDQVNSCLSNFTAYDSKLDKSGLKKIYRVNYYKSYIKKGHNQCIDSFVPFVVDQYCKPALGIAPRPKPTVKELPCKQDNEL